MRRAVGLALGIAACSEGQVASDTVASRHGAGGEAGAAERPTGSSATADEPMIELPLRFAVIGDFGLDGADEAEVAALVAGWDPALVLTVGDNNYPDGLASTIDVNVGKHYQRFIAPYTGRFGPGAAVNRFFPSPGNHDWKSGDLRPYLDYFTLPGNERYYRLRRGPVEFFLLDSDPDEPDGASLGGVQAQWLETGLADSTASFQVVLMHHPPYSSGPHEGTVAMRWPFAAWGADLVIAGHDHDYERLVVDGLPYLVVGTGGAPLREFATEEVGSQRGHADVFGALRAEATATQMTVDFVATSGARVDRLTIAAQAPERWQPLVRAGAAWRHSEARPGADWSALEYAESWPAGPAPLGFGVGGERTTLTGGAPLARPITTYFRHRFQAGPADLGGLLRLRIAVDDGALIRLNGAEVHRINLPEGDIADDTQAAAVVADWFPARMSETLIPGAALQVGDNVLAVEVHQYSRVSTDLRLDLELAAPR